MPDVVLKRAIELAGGPAAPIVVFPQASELADTGDVAVEMWKKAGATDVRWMPLTDAAAARQAVESAAFIWFPGGDQAKLMKAFEGTGVPDVIARRYRDGAVVGGTSAGAAVMSAIMLTGDADLQSITVGATKTAPGLGLWPEVIVDQHHLKRQRQSRLISLVLEHPALVGVGIDERTAAIVSGLALRRHRRELGARRSTPGARRSSRGRPAALRRRATSRCTCSRLGWGWRSGTRRG